MSTVGEGDGQWLTLPVSEFENLGEQIRLRGELIARVTEQRDAYYKLATEVNEEVKAARNNMERVVNILTPLFVQAQDADSPDEEVLGGALDVLTGWFGQYGKPLRRLDELQAENEKLRAQVLYPMHMCVGDSAATMRMLCGRPISDACWTRNPNSVTCRRCAEHIGGGELGRGDGDWMSRLEVEDD